MHIDGVMSKGQRDQLRELSVFKAEPFWAVKWSSIGLQAEV